MKNISIAVASTMSRPADVIGNLRQITESAGHASELGADVLLTPELSASGYASTADVLATAEAAGAGRIYEKLADTARRTSVAIGAGFVEKERDRNFLSHYLVFPDGSFGTQRKIRVTESERPLDSPIGDAWSNDVLQQQGEPFRIFEIKGVRCAFAICADIDIPLLYPFLKERGVQLVFGPSAGGGHRAQRVVTEELRHPEGRTKYLSILESVFFPGHRVRECLEWGMAFAAVNLCGFDGVKYYHVGHGTIVNPMGEVAALCPGIPNLDRQRILMAHATIDVDEKVD